MARAIERLAQMRLYQPSMPLQGEIDFRLPIMADYAGVLPGVERFGGRSVAFTAPDGDAFYRLFVSLQRLAAVPPA
jgi:D-aminopeptidase